MLPCPFFSRFIHETVFTMDNTMNQLAAPAATGFGLYLRTIPTPSHLPTSSHPGSEGSGQESSNQAATQRTKWSEPKDPSLIQKYGSKEIALDVSIQLHTNKYTRTRTKSTGKAEEFPETCPPNLCADDQEHWKRLRESMQNFPPVNNGFPCLLPLPSLTFTSSSPCPSPRA